MCHFVLDSLCGFGVAEVYARLEAAFFMHHTHQTYAANTCCPRRTQPPSIRYGMYVTWTVATKYPIMLAQTTRTVCQRTASKTRPMEIGRDARKGIDRPGAFACQVFLKMATTGPNPRYDTARETMERDFGHQSPTQSFSSAKYKSHIRTPTQHGRATRHGRHCGALTDCLDASLRHTPVPSRPRGHQSSHPPWTLHPPPPHVNRRPE